MSSHIRNLNVTYVQPDQDRPPHHTDDAIKLSLFDTLFIALTPVQRLFFYESDALPPFTALSRLLQSSLAATLAVFTPLAGKLTASSSSDEVFIDFSPSAVTSPGVRFVEAEYAGDDMRRLARNAEHDTEAFLHLVPDLPVRELPAPVLAVQVTCLAEVEGGGTGIVAVGVAVHHTVIDGVALWQFLGAWAAASRGGSISPPPTFDRAAINRRPKAEEVGRKFVRVFAPALPLVNTIPGPDITRQRRKTYQLSAGQILSLKHRISAVQSRGGNHVDPPSTHAAVAALVWTSIVRSKDHAADDSVYLMFAADCRARLRPPLEPTFFGNCAKSCYARATAGELRDGDTGLARAAASVREAVRACLEVEDPMAYADRWLQLHGALPKERVTQIGASQRFMAHEMDFGWDAPSRVELVSVFVREFVALLGLRDGAVQVSVVLDGFEANFLAQL